MPTFSILIPVYNVEKYIKKCLDSVINQTFRDFEAIIIDDCGKDKSVQIAYSYAKTDDRIKIIHHKKNKGLAAARNTALKNAVGKYIVCLDSDDWMEPFCLDILNKEFLLRKTQSIFFNAREFYDDTQTFGSKSLFPVTEGYFTVTSDNLIKLSYFSWIKAYTRKSILKNNLLWPEGINFEDFEFHFKYYTLNPITYVIHDCLINYRQREGSIVNNAHKGILEVNDIYSVIRHMKEFWSDLGIYEDYKLTMLNLVCHRINVFNKLNMDKKQGDLTLKLLKDIGFPEDFEEYKNYYLKINNEYQYNII